MKTDETPRKPPIGKFRAVGAAIGYNILFIALQLVAFTVAAGAIAAFSGYSVDQLRDPLDLNPTVQLVLLLITELVILAVVWNIASRTMTSVLGGDRPEATTFAFYRLLPIALIAAVFAALAPGATEPELDAVFVSVAIALAFTVGFAEEIFFRGLIIDAIRPSGGVAWTAGLSAVAFGLPHLLSSQGVTIAVAANAVSVMLLVGVPFALVRLAGGSILGLSIIHGVIDTVAFVALGGADLPKITVGEAATQLAWAGVICAAYVIWWRRRVMPPMAKSD